MKKIDYILMIIIFVAGFSGILFAQNIEQNTESVIKTNFGIYTSNYTFIPDTSCIILEIDKRLICGNFEILPMGINSEKFKEQDIKKLPFKSEVKTEIIYEEIIPTE